MKIPIWILTLMVAMMGFGSTKHYQLQCNIKWYQQRIVELETELQRIPSIEEWQERIGCEKIDGKLGPQWYKSETQTKWDRAVFNQYAIEHFEKGD